MHAVGGHAVPGRASTTASWLRDEQRLTDAAARSTVQLATRLREDLPDLGVLVQQGAATVEHAAAVVAGVRGLDRQVVQDAAGGLCALALATDPADARKRLRDLATAVDDRLAAEAERRARERAGLRLAEVGAHTAVDGTLAGDDGATVRLAMALAVEAAREAGDSRGKAARQADVLVDWARDYLTRHHGPGDSLAADAHTVRTHLLVTCTPEQLAAEPPTSARPGAQERLALAELLAQDLAGAPPASPGVVGDASPLSRGALRRLACDATVDLVVRSSGTATSAAPRVCGDRGSSCVCKRPVDLLHRVDPLHPAVEPYSADPLHPDPLQPDLIHPGPLHSADPLYVGRSARTVSGRQFRALVVRDRRCVVRGCSRTPAQCAAHHVRHWADGGTSDLDNLVLLCHQHHHDHHDRGHDLPHRDGQRWLIQSGWALDPP